MTTCPHCNHTFKTNYNMKQHIISVHKITMPGVKIYKCNFKNCTFVTGSRVMLNRHNHDKDKEKDNIKPVCVFCKETFANTSSLRRHVRRVHRGGTGEN